MELEKELNDAPTRSSKKCDDKSIRLDTIPALDRETDRKTHGQTDRQTIYRAVHALYADAR